MYKRLATFLGEIINEDQTGFVIGRTTQDSIRSLYVIHAITKEKLQAALISLDAEKTCDWSFLYQTLEKCGFTLESIKCIKTIYDKPTARIKIDGSLTDRLELKRVRRQGCGISPTLFALYTEPLASFIRQREELQGIKSSGREQNIRTVADDILLFLKEINISMPKLMTLLEEFNSYATN